MNAPRTKAERVSFSGNRGGLAQGLLEEFALRSLVGGAPGLAFRSFGLCCEGGFKSCGSMRLRSRHCPALRNEVALGEFWEACSGGFALGILTRMGRDSDFRPEEFRPGTGENPRLGFARRMRAARSRRQSPAKLEPDRGGEKPANPSWIFPAGGTPKK